MSATSTECPNFLTQANTPGNTNATPILNLQEFDIISIGLKVCVMGTNECSPLTPGVTVWGWGGTPMKELRLKELCFPQRRGHHPLAPGNPRRWTGSASEFNPWRTI